MGAVANKIRDVQAVTPFQDIDAVERIDVDQLEASLGLNPFPVTQYGWMTGDKFAGGFGATVDLSLDYYTLRTRSAQLFEMNPYAQGLIKRYVTNIINTGLRLEVKPVERVLGRERGSLNTWSDTVEDMFDLWADDPSQCDFERQVTFGQLQSRICTEALIRGDVLVILREDPLYNVPMIEVVSGDQVATPTGYDRENSREKAYIEWGVELDRRSRRHIAYHVVQKDGTYVRIPAYGSRSGKRQAWLVPGQELLSNRVRGTPLLGIILQSLRELDRYKDANQRKAVVNSILAMVVEKTEDKPGTLPMTGAAVRRGTMNYNAPSSGDNVSRSFSFDEQIPGVVVQELQKGEQIKAFNQAGVDIAFERFEDAVISALAWQMEMPPEILKLSFGSNYNASQAAINEFRMFLNKQRSFFASSFCKPVYCDWIVNEIIVGRLKGSTQMIRSYTDPSRRSEFNAWTASDWVGMIKPSAELRRMAEGYRGLLDMGVITRDQVTKELTGRKYRHVIEQRYTEDQQFVRVAEITAMLGKTETVAQPKPGEDEDED